MEIWTMLKANIKHKKGTFISIVIMMIIISMSLTAIISVKDNADKSVENAMEQVDAGAVTLFMKHSDLSKELMDSVKNHEMVEKVEQYHAICTEQAEANGNEDNNHWYVQKQRKEYRILNENLNGYAKETPTLEKGEIYVPQGVLTKLNCKVGDAIKLTTISGVHRFTIKGAVVEPVNGASVIGLKQVFISDEDFEQIYAKVEKAETEEICGLIQIIQVYKSDDCNKKDSEFKRQVNLDTGIIDYAQGSLTKTQSIHYTNLFPEIIFSILLVFIGLLLVIVLIVIRHSISTGIEMDYVNLGILKAQGFTQGKIRLLFLLQYLFAECIGVVIGMTLAVPLTKTLGSVFQSITAIPAASAISVGTCLLLIGLLLLISVVFIFVTTRKVSTISPVRAISGGHSEIYFDSRIKAPICKKGLMSTLALRQFTANGRRYIGTIFIVSLLVFFMMTIMILGNVVNSKSAAESMGVIYSECDITFKENPDEQTLAKVEKAIEKYSKIEKKYYCNALYLSVNGGEVYCLIYKNPDVLQTLKGRAPLYDNEIVITEILAEELGVEMGDIVTVSQKDKKSEYIISGIFQCMNDTGLCFSMSGDGAKKLGINDTWWGCYSLSNPEQAEKIVKELNREFSDVLEAEKAEVALDDTFQIAIDAMKAVIYIFSIVFALVVVTMVCAKTFMKEKKDIGIFKAIGFTSVQLRLQFAIRFLIVAIIGSALGAVLSVLFSGKMLNVLLRGMGITHMVVSFTAVTFFVPIVLVCGCFFVFAFLVSRKIKKVETRMLVTE